ncbi:MAG: hypothetical protein F2894_08095 [Actinobacteria bacterium]|uniref:Unannotated protein n=1 Tax=freshwater metagenome TaxID=449393 RepID=A0A6J7RB76_9ZZZZ|nr:hypothetical protein [Actinomycetota bacterium]
MAMKLIAKRVGREDGSAVVETAFLGSLIFGIIIQSIVLFGTLQRAALATSAASREVGRVVVLSQGDPEAAMRARYVVIAAARDHGLGDDDLAVSVTGARSRGGFLRVEVRTNVRVFGIPLLERFIPSPSIPVVATHTVRLDKYASAP